MAEITLFARANVAGRSQVIPKGRYDDALPEISTGNATLSSLRVFQGLGVSLSRHSQCHKRSIDIKEDTLGIPQFWHTRPSLRRVDGETQQPPMRQEAPILTLAHPVDTTPSLPQGQDDTAQIRSADYPLRSAPWPCPGVAGAWHASNGGRVGAMAGQP
jgi:hypothetical protein